MHWRKLEPVTQNKTKQLQQQRPALPITSVQKLFTGHQQPVIQAFPWILNSLFDDTKLRIAILWAQSLTRATTKLKSLLRAPCRYVVITARVSFLNTTLVPKLFSSEEVFYLGLGTLHCLSPGRRGGGIITWFSEGRKGRSRRWEGIKTGLKNINCQLTASWRGSKNPLSAPLPHCLNHNPSLQAKQGPVPLGLF